MIRTLIRGAATTTAVFLFAASVPAWADEGGVGDTQNSHHTAGDGERHDGERRDGERRDGDRRDEDGRDGDRRDHRHDPEEARADSPVDAGAADDGADHGEEQSVTVTDIDVAVAATGGNTIGTTDPTTDADATDAVATHADDTDGVDADGVVTDDSLVGTTSVATGAADAVGSQDSTSVAQAVDTVLTGDATADITQIVFVFNIGAASANSGANGSGGLPATGSGSAVSTGGAVAIGQSGSTYVTQAGSADATGQSDDQLSQLSVTVRIGVAVADSGGNSATGGSGSSGVSTGTATAVGNDSLTDVSQSATAAGSGSASITIEQRAIVINVGMAMANTGLNQVGDLTGELMAMPEQEVAEQLFAVLLPSLLASYAADASGASGGTVATGDATAIGNQTSTYVNQTATATATGDGNAVLQQQVVVANIGAAVANTGVNQSGATSQSLDPAQQEMVVQLAAFLAALLAAANSWEPGTELPTTPGSLSLPAGDLLIGIDGSLTGSLVDVSNGTGGPSATVRQIVAVVSLGVSSANSGENETVAVALGDDGSVMLIPGSSIVTGDASAVNSAVIVICQLDDAGANPCLAPGVVGSSGPPVAGVDGDESMTLPRTGSDTATTVWFAALVVSAGAALLLVGRRRNEVA